jgi:diadenosine tetraphosphate (Ap4A) HIT family hydrolase
MNSDEVILLETKFWKVILIENQAYLGRSVIVLKRGAKSMSEITSEEWQEFHTKIVLKLESAFKKAFNATLFNWTCLMNHAYKNNPPTPWVHWHFRPRYGERVDFNGKTFTDLEFSHHYNSDREMIVSKEMLKAIAKKVKEYF